MIHIEKKFIFLEVPKTGTSSIISLLSSSNKDTTYRGWDECNKKYIQHLTINELIEFNYLKESFVKSAFKFAFVRNPWDRAVSGFNYRITNGGTGYSSYYSLKQYLHSYTHKPKEKSNDYYSIQQHIKPQYDFAYDADGKQIVDFIGKFENLQEDFDIICDKIKIPQQKLPHKNKSKHKHYTEYYDDETKQIVAEKYANDIEYFGYEFGE